MFISKISVLLLIFTGLILPFGDKGDIIITFSQIEKNKGYIEAAVYDSEDGAPTDLKKSLSKKRTAFSGAEVIIIFKEVKFGTYAIAAYYDENSNCKMNTNFQGVPS